MNKKKVKKKKTLRESPIQLEISHIYPDDNMPQISKEQQREFVELRVTKDNLRSINSRTENARSRFSEMHRQSIEIANKKYSD